MDELLRSLGVERDKRDPSFDLDGVRQLVDSVFLKVEGPADLDVVGSIATLDGIHCFEGDVRHRVICSGVWNHAPHEGRDFATQLGEQLHAKLRSEDFDIEGWSRDRQAEEALGLDWAIYTLSASRAQGDWKVILRREERPSIGSMPAGVVVELMVDRAE